jgi:O-antigen/teichoic acid export membrane protein
VILAVVVPISVLGIAGAEVLLRLWLGAEFARHGTLTMQILFVGFTLNAISQLPFVALHSLGMTRATALLHAAELPIYVAVLVVLAQEFGLPGAAAAWGMRALADCIALNVMLKLAQHKVAIPTSGEPRDAVIR